MYAVTNTRTKFSGAMNTSEWIKTDFIGCFETLEEAQEAVTKFMDKVKAKVEEVRTSSYGKYEFYVTEVRMASEYVNNLEIHERLARSDKRGRNDTN
ncbi:hypothetical protein HCG60_09930 [Ligilactobacillus murinus]|uniref:hypothetical protein n=1 Tax=Ligilactobacillus murinus TaxID=1622 RepID=UPI001C8C39B1|nr:hypothetical protein [Ligilactobacillus murinus]MBX9013341.1 hypothetical protein [Ligilactobacillus murinus]